MMINFNSHSYINGDCYIIKLSLAQLVTALYRGGKCVITGATFKPTRQQKVTDSLAGALVRLSTLSSSPQNWFSSLKGSPFSLV